MKKFLSVILGSVLIFTLTACGKSEATKETSTSTSTNTVTKEAPKVITKVETPVVKNDEIQSREVVLYFSDDQSMYLVGEKRTLKAPTAKSIVEELIKGPVAKSDGSAKLYATLPVDLQVLDVQVKDNIAYVNFKKEFKVEGSAGENMALYSIINSLTLDKELGIKKVQFLVNGKNVATMGGQTDVSSPFSEKDEMLKK